jgi:UDP:flavonoid glycosyltransferase YjiC (YdhE family)
LSCPEHDNDNRAESATDVKVLIASTPAWGHLYPLLTAGRALRSHGHEVVVLSAHALRELIEDSGATFREFPAVADFDLRNVEDEFPGFGDIPSGPERNLWILKRASVDTIPAQHEAIQQVLHDFPADIILADNFLFGALPMLLGPRSKRLPIVMLGTMGLHLSRDDGAPPFAGLPPAADDVQREEHKAVYQTHHAGFLGPLNADLESCLLGMGIKPPAMSMFDSTVLLPDAYLQLTAPSFEFPRQHLPASVRFVGTPPIVANQAPLPPWAHDLDGSRKVVLVTQGTLSNHDFSELVVPALGALAEEPDLLVVVTAGGRSSATIPGLIPDNARLADYLPLEWLFPRVDALVTNGGYGTVNQALSYGIPIVGAGLSEDKPDVNARVAWSGAGIDLQTTMPAPEALRAAVRHVLDEPQYRMRAKVLAAEFATLDATSEILAVLTELAGAGPLPD